MLHFKIRKSASVFDNQMGSGQIWVADPQNIEYLLDDPTELAEAVPIRICWRVKWTDRWEWIDAFWMLDESGLFVDDIMRFEEDQSVMFFVPKSA